MTKTKPTSTQSKRRPRKNVRRRSSTASQAEVTKRLRETFGSGFDYDMGHDPEDYRKVREAMRELAADDAFWAACEQASELREKARKLVESVT